MASLVWPVLIGIALAPVRLGTGLLGMGFTGLGVLSLASGCWAVRTGWIVPNVPEDPRAPDDQGRPGA